MTVIQDKKIFQGTEKFIAPLKDGKFAIYSKEKGYITDFIFDKIGYVSKRNYFVVRKDNKNMLIDTEGKQIDFPSFYPNSFLMEYAMHIFFRENLTVAVIGDKTGMIDTKGKTVIPFEYKRISGCYDGLIPVTDFQDREGYIDKQNNVVIPLGKYTNCQSFEFGIARVRDRKLGYVYIDKTGKIIDKIIFNGTDEYTAPLKDDKFAIHSKTKGFITDFIFNRICYCPDGNYFVVRKRLKNMLIDTQGKQIPFPVFCSENFYPEALKHLEVYSKDREKFLKIQKEFIANGMKNKIEFTTSCDGVSSMITEIIPPDIDRICPKCHHRMKLTSGIGILNSGTHTLHSE